MAPACDITILQAASLATANVRRSTSTLLQRFEAVSMSQCRSPAAAQSAAINRVSPPLPGDTLRVLEPDERNVQRLCTLCGLAYIISDLLQVLSHGSPPETTAYRTEYRCRAGRSSGGQVLHRRQPILPWQKRSSQRRQMQMAPAAAALCRTSL